MRNIRRSKTRSEKLYDLLQPLSRAMELEKAAACKIQTTASKGCLAFFQNVLYKGYSLYLAGLTITAWYLYSLPCGSLSKYQQRHFLIPLHLLVNSLSLHTVMCLAMFKGPFYTSLRFFTATTAIITMISFTTNINM